MKNNEPKDRYLGTMEWEGAKALCTIWEALEKEGAELVGCNWINAVNRYDQSERIDNTPESYIKYLLGDYVVYLEFHHFWAFEGPSLTVEKVTEDSKGKCYHALHYKENVEGVNTEDLAPFIADLISLDGLYRKQHRIVNDREYTSRKHYVVPTFYYQ